MATAPNVVTVTAASALGRIDQVIHTLASAA